MHNLHKLDISAYNSRFSKKSIITAVFFLAIFKFAWVCLVIITLFEPKRYSASMQIPLISIIYAKTNSR